MFRKEILEKGTNVKEFWCRYEWQHRGFLHVHGFIWIEGAPNVDKIDWSNEEALKDIFIPLFMHGTLEIIIINKIYWHFNK